MHGTSAMGDVAEIGRCKDPRAQGPDVFFYSVQLGRASNLAHFLHSHPQFNMKTSTQMNPDSVFFERQFEAHTEFSVQ